MKRAIALLISTASVLCVTPAAAAEITGDQGVIQPRYNRHIDVMGSRVHAAARKGSTPRQPRHRSGSEYNVLIS